MRYQALPIRRAVSVKLYCVCSVFRLRLFSKPMREKLTPSVLFSIAYCTCSCSRETVQKRRACSLAKLPLNERILTGKTVQVFNTVRLMILTPSVTWQLALDRLLEVVDTVTRYLSPLLAAFVAVGGIV